MNGGAVADQPGAAFKESQRKVERMTESALMVNYSFKAQDDIFIFFYLSDA